jgi:hypothetical protein
MRSTEVVSLPSVATNPHVSALSRAQEAVASAATRSSMTRRCEDLMIDLALG